MKANPKTCLVALFLTFLAHWSVAADLHSLTTADAAKLATSIPVTTSLGAASNVEARMKNIGLVITGGKAYSYDTKSELEQPSDKVGDLHFTIQGTQPTAEFKRTTCDMWGNADFMKRRGKFYPENRTANWLMTGECSTRFAKPR